jgi:hypothetical protein
VTSSDLAVLEPVPADAADGWAVATGEAFAELRAAPRGAGTAWLRVAAPGYAPESVSVRVTAARRLRFVDPVYRDVARTVIGARQSSGLEDAVLVDGADGGGPPYAVITLTQRHPERVRIAATLPVDLTSGRRTLRFAGLAVGVDTLVASAPGLLPDTLVVHVSTPRLIVRGRSGERTLPDSGRVTTPLAVSLFVGDSLGRAHFPLDGPVPLAATSSDAAVLRVGAAVTVGTSSGGSGDVWVRLLDVGTGTLTFSDPAGRLAPVTIPPVRVVATPLVVGAGTSPHAVVRVGMGQRLGDGHYLFGIPQNGSSFDTDLRARASDARLLPRVAVLAPVPNESGRRTVDVTAGDTTGAAWVILSAPGLLTDSVRVEVGRPRLGVLVDEPSSFDPRTPGDTVGVSVRVYDQGGGVRMTDRAVDLVLESSDPAVVRVVSPSLTAVAGSSGVRTRVVIVGPGAAVLRAREPGTSYARYEDGTSGPISVPPPTP